MLTAMAIVLFCQLFGEACAQASGLPVPGPVIGLVLLFIGLLLRDRIAPRAKPLAKTPLGRLAAILIGNLTIMFIPASAGIIQQGEVLRHYGLALAVAVVLSTMISLAVTGAVFSMMVRFMGRG